MAYRYHGLTSRSRARGRDRRHARAKVVVDELSLTQPVLVSQHRCVLSYRRVCVISDDSREIGENEGHHAMWFQSLRV